MYIPDPKTELSTNSWENDNGKHEMRDNINT